MDVPPLVLDRTSSVPLAVQLADALRAATAVGALHAGDRLPSTRALAAALRVSRTVTAAAYDQLLAEGWVVGRRGAGTFVVAVPAMGPERARTSRPGPAAPVPIDLRAGPALPRRARPRRLAAGLARAPRTTRPTALRILSACPRSGRPS